MKVKIGTTFTVAEFSANKDLIRSVGAMFKSEAREYEMDVRWKRLYPTKRFYLFDETTHKLIIPRGFTEFLITVLKDFDITVHTHRVDPIVPENIDININDGISLKENQKTPVSFLSNSDPGMYALPLQTGQGKTCIAIHALVNLGQRAMVITSGLVDQWCREMEKFTDIEDLYIMQGYKSLSSLMHSDYKPSVILCSLETLRRFVLGRDNYDELPMTYGGFLQHYGIGTKIADEVHEKYHSIVLTDLLSNVKNNIYLSATFSRNDDKGKKIFNTIYPQSIMCETDTYEKYCKITMYSYALEVKTKRVLRTRGYMHAKYEAELFKRVTKFKTFIEGILQKIIDSHFLNIRKEGEKMLIYFLTNEMVEKTNESLSRLYPELKIINFISDTRDDVLLDPDIDIILSSPKKAGVGTDIKNLRTIINTISTKAETSLIQFLGRLRKLKNSTPEFIDIYNRTLGPHLHHARTKRGVYQGRALVFKHEYLQ